MTYDRSLDGTYAGTLADFEPEPPYYQTPDGKVTLGTQPQLLIATPVMETTHFLEEATPLGNYTLAQSPAPSPVTIDFASTSLQETTGLADTDSQDYLGLSALDAEIGQQVGGDGPSLYVGDSPFVEVGLTASESPLPTVAHLTAPTPQGNAEVNHYRAGLPKLNILGKREAIRMLTAGRVVNQVEVSVGVHRPGEISQQHSISVH